MNEKDAKESGDAVCSVFGRFGFCQIPRLLMSFDLVS